jgi:hypothetical protein
LMLRLICGWQGFIKQFLPCYKTLEDIWQEIKQMGSSFLDPIKLKGDLRCVYFHPSPCKLTL